MESRLGRYNYTPDENNSRVVRNQELYKKIYEENSYFSNDEKVTPLEKTNEIDIEKVRELLKSRENYRKEIKMRELNIVKEPVEEKVEEDLEEEKNYDINYYLNKAASERDSEPYHKIDNEVLESLPKEIEKEEVEEIEKTNIEDLAQMGNTELSLEMFGNLKSNDEKTDEEDVTQELENTEEIEEPDEEEIEDKTIDSTFFTDSIKIHVASDSEDDDEEEEGTSLVVKIVVISLVIVIVALVLFLLFM